MPNRIGFSCADSRNSAAGKAMTHGVRNDGDTGRIHLVVDFKVNSWLHHLITRAEKKTINQSVDTKDWDKIIPQLRAMGTPAALAAADDMEKQLTEILAK